MSEEMKLVDDLLPARPFTIQPLSNSEIMNLILFYYKGREGSALDITYGVGTFWKKKPSGWKLRAFDSEPFGIAERLEWGNLGGQIWINRASMLLFLILLIQVAREVLN